jgi:Fe-S cluster assembly ATPase SufC
VFGHLSVLENVRVALQRKLGTSFHFWRAESSLRTLDAQALDLLDQVDLRAYAALPAVELSYGRKRALEIATTLAMEPTLMLLDEPTQGMGLEDVDRIRPADQEGRGEPDGADGRAQHERRRVDRRHDHRARARRDARRRARTRKCRRTRP